MDWGGSLVLCCQGLEPLIVVGEPEFNVCVAFLFEALPEVFHPGFSRKDGHLGKENAGMEKLVSWHIVVEYLEYLLLLISQ